MLFLFILRFNNIMMQRVVFVILFLWGLGLCAQHNPKEGTIKVRKPYVHQFFLDIDSVPDYKYGNVLSALQSLVVYPVEALEKEISGTVYLYVIIDIQGKIEHVSLRKGVHELLDRAAINAAYKLEGFVPYEKNGKKVAVRFTLPLNFVIK
jgi:periplasmic protein TonB